MPFVAKKMNCKPPLIQINHLNFFYQKNQVLEDIHLSVKVGDFLAILGPNGGGKTTLLKIILGLLPPSSGEVQVFGKSPKQAFGQIGFVPQLGVMDPYFPINVEDVVLMGLERPKRWHVHPGYPDKGKAKAIDAMKKTEVLHLAKKRIGQLSGGERQRVFLSRALISDPELLIFDEPTANIDPYGTACFFDLFNLLAQTKTLMIVTHDLGITAANINRIACLNKQLIYHDKPTLTSEMLPFLYGTDHPNCSAEHPLNLMMQSFNQNKQKHSDDT